MPLFCSVLCSIKSLSMQFLFLSGKCILTSQIQTIFKYETGLHIKTLMEKQDGPGVRGNVWDA